MIKRVLGALLLITLASPALPAQSLCAGSADVIAKSRPLAEAVEVAFPGAKEGDEDEDDCVLPVAFFDFATRPVLITQAKPVQCHGCGANLSALVFTRSGGKISVAGTTARFLAAGSWGRASEIKSARLGTSDVIMVEAVYSGQGSLQEVVYPVLVKSDRVRLLAQDGIQLSFDGAENSQTAIKGAWASFPDGRFVVSYSGKAKNKPVRQTLTMLLRGGKLVQAAGKTPSNMLP